MNECEYRKNGLTTCEVIGLVLGIIAGIASGILFSLGLIPVIINFIIIALVTSAISLAILFGTLFAANSIKWYNAFYRCICFNLKFLLTGAVGTILIGAIALAIELITTSITSIVLVALVVFFFVIMIVSLICLFSCIIRNTCKIEKE